MISFYIVLLAAAVSGAWGQSIATGPGTKLNNICSDKNPCVGEVVAGSAAGIASIAGTAPSVPAGVDAIYVNTQHQWRCITNGTDDHECTDAEILRVLSPHQPASEGKSDHPVPAFHACPGPTPCSHDSGFVVKHKGDLIGDEPIHGNPGHPEFGGGLAKLDAQKIPDGLGHSCGAYPCPEPMDIPAIKHSVKHKHHWPDTIQACFGKDDNDCHPLPDTDETIVTWGCADKSRILLTSEDGKHHCIKLPKD
jgi:hypothetical protein